MNFEDIKVKIDKPYPQISDACQNKETVKVLKQLCNSRHGELTGILNYLFQYTVADSCVSEVASVLEEISVVEMMHMDMLMHAITDFGGSPRYEDANGMCFTTNNFTYPIKLKEMLDNDIIAEEIAIDNYTQAIEMVDNKSLKELFARIIEDEQMHIKALTMLRSNVSFMSI